MFSISNIFNIIIINFIVRTIETNDENYEEKKIDKIVTYLKLPIFENRRKMLQ